MSGEETWKVLERAINEIFEHSTISEDNASNLSFLELYRNAFDKVTTHGEGEKLYSWLVTTMTGHLREVYQSIESAEGEIFLEKLVTKWEDHNKALRMIGGILMYMDQTFVKRNHKTPVHELGLNLWENVFIHSNKTQSRLLNTLLELVLKERNGSEINRGLMRNVIEMLMDLGLSVYQKGFEKQFLEVSAKFYSCESQKFIESCDCGDYLQKAERRLNEEKERVSNYLDARSESKITKVVEKEMIENHMHTIVHMENSGLVNMIMDAKYEDLQRMYNLFHRVPDGLTIVKDEMNSLIQDTGKQLILDPERSKDPVDSVKRLLDLKKKCDKVITLAFENDKTFQNASNSAFEHFINLSAQSPEFISLFVDEKYEDLRTIYSLFHSVPDGLTLVKDQMTSLIRNAGEQLILDPDRLEDPVDLVQRLLDLKDKYDKFITSAFKDDETFLNALSSAFVHFINLNSGSPEFISLFVDDKLRKGVSEADVDGILGKVMMLFRYLNAKDVFVKYYRQHLAKRLLSGKTKSYDADRSLIVKLKAETSEDFTVNLENMLKDIDTSKDRMKDFYARHGNELQGQPKLSVQVVSKLSWPTQSSDQCKLPLEILDPCNLFESYYLRTNKLRKFSWQTNMGSAILKATFDNGKIHELKVSTYQMCVLMLFNNADRLTCKEIEQATSIPLSDLRKCLQSLACVKGKNVLGREPMSKDIAEDDIFFFNDKFKSNSFRVKIGRAAVAQMESEPEYHAARARMEQNRGPQVEAAIVNIMKSRRVLNHNSLVINVTEKLQKLFLPDPVLIKKKIDSLIDRDFLERDKQDRKLYHYVA